MIAAPAISSSIRLLLGFVVTGVFTPDVPGAPGCPLAAYLAVLGLVLVGVLNWFADDTVAVCFP